jgi:predicted transcriptional regulator
MDTKMIRGLSRDEMDALVQVSKMSKGSKPSACFGRNAKKLVGIKLLIPRRDGTYALTDKGSEALFVNRCIRGLQALADEPTTRLDSDVAQFLSREGHIADTSEGHYVVTAKGRECLEDIAQNL